MSFDVVADCLRASLRNAGMRDALVIRDGDKALVSLDIGDTAVGLDIKVAEFSFGDIPPTVAVFGTMAMVAALAEIARLQEHLGDLALRGSPPKTEPRWA